MQLYGVFANEADGFENAKRTTMHAAALIATAFKQLMEGK